MLEIKNITKKYKTGDFTQTALDNVSIKFRKNEFVSILGKSGSGKTTLLNIISGLDHYDSGDLIINGKTTKKFKDKDWDSYRNNSIGFIFQSYNLIPHISVLKNVELGLTLSGVSKKVKQKKSLEALKRVGLLNHINKKPNQLSGGEKQRVAIARALANDPDIILADEPTGALDTKTSIQIMELIKEISKDKLVIMVTHNPEIAQKYSTRIIELSDGKIQSDTAPYNEQDTTNTYTFKKTAMSFLTAISLSFENIKTKKGRTILTAFASSIGIIGISIILSLSNGFDKQIDSFEQDTLSSFPIIISKETAVIDKDSLTQLATINKQETKKVIYSYDRQTESILHTNKIDNNYIEYVENIKKDNYDAITYIKTTNFNLLINNKINTSSTFNMQSLPLNLDTLDNYINTNYELLSGKLPTKKEEILLYVDSKNRLDTNLISAIGLEEKDEYNYNDFLNIEFKIVNNDDYYLKYNDIYTINNDIDSISKKDLLKIKIVGIVKAKEDNAMARMEEVGYISSNGGILYPSELQDYVIEQNKTSKIVTDQKKVNYNILTKQEFTTKEEKENFLGYLADDSIPYAIYIYPKDFDSKDNILKYLDDYNQDLSDDDKIVYTDMAKTIVDMSSGIMDAITYVLIAFSAVSLVVSGIMIGIIIYISVLERTKEIGILRSLGARKKDITRVFNAETFIIGLSSGILGIVIAYLSLFPINKLLLNLTELENVAKMSPLHVVLMIAIAILVTSIGGFIPSKMASRKDPVEALRTE